MKKIVSIILTLALVMTAFTSISFGADKKIGKIKITSPSAKTYTIKVGSKITFKTKLSPKGLSKNAKKNVKWKSSAPKIASVSQKGVVKGKAIGTAKITVYSKSNKKIKAVKKIKVVAPMKSVFITGKLVVGNTLTAKFSPKKAKVKYAWYRVENGKRVAIKGANSKTYIPNPTDAGKIIKVGVTGKGYYKGTKYSSGVTISSAEDAFRKAVNGQYGIDIMKTLISRKSNPELGFRLSGSQAEKDNSETIVNEYKKMGLNPVTDKIKTDGFEYKKGKLTYNDGTGDKTVDMGSYQTTFQTNGPKQYELVYAGKGYKKDYDDLISTGININGKIVLIDTDQYNEYWINFPAFEAKTRGAAAVIACESSPESSAYAMMSDDQIQVNDICGPADGSALSVSRNTSKALKELIGKSSNGIINVTLDVDAKVTPDQGSQNIWVEIPGKSKETIIIMAHYDSYWNAALDNADGTGVLMTLAKALKESGYVPEKTIRFVHHGAEEWGMSDSIYDWAIGAFRQIKEVHPEWQETAFVALNVDSFTVENRGPSAANGAMYKKIRINAPQLDSFAKTVIDKNLPAGYSFGRYDTVANNFFEDFSYLTSGIPKMLFTRSDYQSQFDTYHSSFDNFDYYSNIAKQDVIMGDKAQIVGAAVMAFDKQLIQPVNYESYFATFNSAGFIDETLGGSAATAAKNAAREAEATAKNLDAAIAKINSDYGNAVATNNKTTIAKLKTNAAAINQDMFKLYKDFQQNFTRLDHAGTVVAPHEAYQVNLEALKNAWKALDGGNINDALDKISSVDSNGLALDFSKATYDWSVAQKTGVGFPVAKMSWGAGMITEANQNLYDVVGSLAGNPPTVGDEMDKVNEAITAQQGILTKTLTKETNDFNTIKNSMGAILAKLQ